MKKELKGFTIIEVVLVLALAGIIFMMVFIALPQMIRQQRDAQRKDDVMMFVEAVKKFQTNNRGVLPDDKYKGDARLDYLSWEGFVKKYIDDKYGTEEQTFGDPSEGSYEVAVVECGEKNQGSPCTNTGAKQSDIMTFDHTMHVVTQAVCGEEQALATVNPRDFAVLYRTESSGLYCFDSQSDS